MWTTEQARFFAFEDKMQRAGSQLRACEVPGHCVPLQAQHRRLELLAHALPIEWPEPW